AVGADAGAAGDVPHRERTRRTCDQPESPDERALVAVADTDDVGGTVVDEVTFGRGGPDGDEVLSVAVQSPHARLPSDAAIVDPRPPRQPRPARDTRDGAAAAAAARCSSRRTRSPPRARDAAASCGWRTRRA